MTTEPSEPQRFADSAIDESSVAVSNTRRVKATVTKTMYVDVPAEEAAWLLDPECDSTIQAEHFDRWQRIAAHGHEHIEAWLDFEDASEETFHSFWSPEVIDAAGQERYLASARHFLGRARYELSLGRYREGYCPDLDRVNGELGRTEEAIRLMMLESQGVDWPEVRAWRWLRWTLTHIARHGLLFGASQSDGSVAP